MPPNVPIPYDTNLIDLIFPIILITVIIFSSGVLILLLEPLIEKFNKHFICPRKGHKPRHKIKTIYEKCNLNYNHYKGYEQLPETYCERCYTDL